MTNSADFAKLLGSWYQTEARPFLADVANDRIPQLDQELKRLEDLVGTLGDDLPVCFLGTSGVGKSTLINAVVAGREVLLPAGGVGPLTAEATLVKYAAERLFRVSYHAPTKLNKLLLALERAHEKELLRQGLTPEADGGGVDEPLSEEEREEAELASTAPTESPDPRQSQAPDMIGVLARQASHLIRGDQYAALDRGYALDRLRDCLNLAPRWKTEATSEDLARIEKIKNVLARARRHEGKFEVRAKDDELAFGLELEQHAAGFLAPLIRTIEVGWDADLLKSGVVLIDLPGLGVANDEFRRVTAHWIRRARAVVLVVDRAGMSEASADLLRTSGFLNSLLHESHDPEKLNVTLIVAVVKLDSTADDARAKEKLTNPSKVRPWAAHFDEACERATLMVREQMSTELQKVSELGGESTRGERGIVIRQVLEGMQVHPVVAPEYRKFLAEDEDEPPRIKSAEQSRVPKLARAFEEVAQERTDRIDARIEFLARNVGDRLRGALELTQARGEHESKHHQEQSERVRKDLALFAAPLRTEIVNKQGEFREFLRSTVPLQIESRVDAASQAARNDIKKRLKTYRGYHWGTIRAAVRRGGVYEGSRMIDIPADLALLFEDPIAIVWSIYILQALRAKTAAIGKEYVSVVGELVEWGRRQGNDLDPKVLEALHKDLQAEMKGLALVGREAIDELKATVKGELYLKLEKKVRQRCQQFVKSGADRGAGVMNRMLEMLDEMADLVVEAAQPIARDVLTKHYREVEGEIRSKFDKYRNPVDVALKELVGEPDDPKKEEVTRQREIARRAKLLLSSMPQQTLPSGVEASS
jgi:GTP-binding protein EngB required for normal cell division